MIRGWTRWVPAPARTLYRTHVEPWFDGRTRTRTPEGVQLRGDLKHLPYYLGLALHDPRTEPLARRIFARHAASARGVVDVGAYLGVYALLAARLPGARRVWALEPDPASFRSLAHAVAENQADVRCLPVAASDRRATLPFTPVHPLGGASHVGEGAGAIRVEALPLDEVVGDAPVDLVKIDVEGHEPEVLDGAARLLRRDRPVLLVEHDHANLARQGHVSRDLQERLAALDYDVAVVDERRRRLVPVTVAALAEGHVNLYARPREARRSADVAASRR